MNFKELYESAEKGVLNFNHTVKGVDLKIQLLCFLKYLTIVYPDGLVPLVEHTSQYDHLKDYPGAIVAYDEDFLIDKIKHGFIPPVLVDSEKEGYLKLLPYDQKKTFEAHQFLTKGEDPSWWIIYQEKLLNKKNAHNDPKLLEIIKEIGDEEEADSFIRYLISWVRKTRSTSLPANEHGGRDWQILEDYFVSTWRSAFMSADINRNAYIDYLNNVKSYIEIKTGNHYHNNPFPRFFEEVKNHTYNFDVLIPLLNVIGIYENNNFRFADFFVAQKLAINDAFSKYVSLLNTNKISARMSEECALPLTLNRLVDALYTTKHRDKEVEKTLQETVEDHSPGTIKSLFNGGYILNQLLIIFIFKYIEKFNLEDWAFGVGLPSPLMVAFINGAPSYKEFNESVITPLTELYIKIQTEGKAKATKQGADTLGFDSQDSDNTDVL
jgi:hypothetical protein